MKKNTIRRTIIILSSCLIILGGVFHSVQAQTGLDLILHFVQGIPLPEQVAYQVEVYISVLDGDGDPVKGLDQDDFSVTEDSRKVDIDSVTSAESAPLNLVLVVDTSGSMGGSGIRDARSAASSFVSNLNDDDQVALLSFNESVVTDQEFSPKHNTVRSRINTLEAIPNSGTCLYDAAYKAAQLAGTAPTGRRAIILLTDGVDETSSGEVCSSFTADDVIDYAAGGATGVPIYTLGVGAQVDEKILKRLSGLSGGNYLHAPQSSNLKALFQQLTDQFNSQYLITYISTSARGEHSLVVEVNHNGNIDQDSRNFLLPALPITLNIISPTITEIDVDQMTVIASVSGGGEKIGSLELFVDGKMVDTDDTAPYELDLDLTEYSYGGLLVEVRAIAEDGSELASDQITITRIEEAPEVFVQTGEEGEETPDDAPLVEEEASSGSFLGLGLALLAGGIGVFLVVFFLRKRKKEQQDLEDFKFPVRDRSDLTLDGYPAQPDEYGILKVTFSDDGSMVGQEFRLTKSPTMIGRSADNDVIIPDNPISRNHALIYLAGDQVQLEDQESRYGTFVNNKKVGSKRVDLSNLDEIRLGNRTKVLFTKVEKIAPMDDMPTYDDLEIPAELRDVDLSGGLEKTVKLDQSDQTLEMPDDDHTLEMPHDGTREMKADDHTIEMPDSDQTQEMSDPDDTNTME